MCFFEHGRAAGCVDGTVTGWLPAEESDFVSELTRDPAALWHVRFDTDEVWDVAFCVP